MFVIKLTICTKVLNRCKNASLKNGELIQRFKRVVLICVQYSCKIIIESERRPDEEDS